jgi:serine/threonine protein kinase
MEDVYQYQEKIGKGEFGSVYRVKKGTKEIALKVLSVDNFEQLRLVKREIQVLESLKCLPSLVCYYGNENIDNTFYIEMEYISGKNLQKFSQEYRADSNLVRYMTSIMSDLMNGISYIHQVNVVHRDIKPDNIMIQYPQIQPKLIDFGLACVSLPHERCPDEKCCLGKTGTPFFMPPETLLRGLSYPKSDLWSLAASIYTSVTTLTVYIPQPATMQRLKIESTRAPELITTGNDALNDLLERMLNKDYNQRPSDEQVIKFLKDRKADFN